MAWRIAVSAARDEVETIFACPRSDGFDSGCSFLAARLNQLGERWKLVEPTCERQRAGRVETKVQVSGDLWSGFGYRMQGGFDSGRSFFAARLNQLGERWKLVEPTCERQRAGRVETVVTVVGVWLPGVSGGFDPGCSFFAARLDRLDVL